METIPGLAARFYAALVPRFRVTRWLYSEIVREVKERFSGGIIVDIGTGPGVVPCRLAGELPYATIVGLDLSPSMVLLASRRARSHSNPSQLTFLIGDVSHLPLKTGSLPLVISSMSLHHWRDAGKGLREICRCLKPGGRSLIYDIKRDLTRQEKREIGKRFGFLMGLLLIYFVRAHSSISTSRLKGLLKELEGEGIHWSLESYLGLIKLSLARGNSQP